MSKIVAISWKKFHKFLLSIGCSLAREKGDHLIYKKEGLKRPIVVVKETEIPVFIIKSNLRTLNISTEEYLEKIRKL